MNTEPNVASLSNYFWYTGDCMCVLTFEVIQGRNNGKSRYDFLLVINSDLSYMSPRFRDIAPRSRKTPHYSLSPSPIEGISFEFCRQTMSIHCMSSVSCMPEKCVYCDKTIQAMWFSLQRLVQWLNVMLDKLDNGIRQG